MAAAFVAIALAVALVVVAAGVLPRLRRTASSTDPGVLAAMDRARTGSARQVVLDHPDEEGRLTRATG